MIWGQSWMKIFPKWPRSIQKTPLRGCFGISMQSILNARMGEVSDGILPWLGHYKPSSSALEQLYRWCLYLRHLSGKAYETLRQSGVLKLPSQRTLRDYTHYIPATTGFSAEVDKMLMDTMKVYYIFILTINYCVQCHVHERSNHVLPINSTCLS